MYVKPFGSVLLPPHRSWRHVVGFTAFTAGTSSAAMQAARAAWPRDRLGSVDGADGFWSEWQLRRAGRQGWRLRVEEVKFGGVREGGCVLGEELVGSVLGSARNNSVAPVRLLPDTSLI